MYIVVRIYNFVYMRTIVCITSVHSQIYSGASLSRTPLGNLFLYFIKGVLYSGVYKVLISLTWDIDRSVL